MRGQVERYEGGKRCMGRERNHKERRRWKGRGKKEREEGEERKRITFFSYVQLCCMCLCEHTLIVPILPEAGGKSSKKRGLFSIGVS